MSDSLDILADVATYVKFLDCISDNLNEESFWSEEPSSEPFSPQHQNEKCTSTEELLVFYSRESGNDLKLIMYDQPTSKNGVSGNNKTITTTHCFQSLKPKSFLKHRGRPMSLNFSVYLNIHKDIRQFICLVLNLERFIYIDIFNQEQSYESVACFSSSKHLNIALVHQLNDKLQQLVGNDELSFVKLYRDQRGVLAKLELIAAPPVISIKWLKHNICYPRYKAGMKLHIVKGTSTNMTIFCGVEAYMWEKENVQNFIIIQL